MGSKVLAGFVLATVSLGLAFGCGGGDAQGNQITYWATNEGPSVEADKKILGEPIKQFEKENNVQVDLQVIPWDNLYQRILTATTSGEGPDVLNIGNTWSAALQATGAFMPYDEDAMRAIGGQDKFAAAPLTSTGAPGETPTAVPLYSVPDAALFYNKAMYEDAGIGSPPKTWNEFLADAEKLTKDTDGDGKIDQWGMAMAGGDPIDNIHRGFVLSRQQGGAFFDDKGNPTFDSPANVRAVEQYVDLVTEQKVASPVSAETDGTQVRTQFADGDAAMMLGPISTIGTLKERGMKEDEFGVTLTPLPDPLPAGGEKVRGYVSGSNISIFNNTDNEEGALEFVKFMTSKKQQIELANAYGNFPTVKSALENPDFEGGKRDVFQKVVETSAPMPQVPREGEFETLVGDAMVRLFEKAATKGTVSEADVRKELSAAQEKIEASMGGG